MSYRLHSDGEFEVILHPKNNLRSLYLEITNDCNLQCTMCYRQAWEQGTGFMPLETAQKVYEQLKPFSTLERIVLGGIGEPSYHPDFLAMVSLFSRNYPVTIATNGTLLSDRVLQHLVDEGVAELIISVDSSKEEEFQEIRKTDLAPVFESQRLLAKKKKEKGSPYPRISWEFVAMKSNLETLPQVVMRAAELGVSTLYISHMMPVTLPHAKEILYAKGVSNELETIFHRARNMGIARGINVVLPTTELKTDRYCRFVNQSTATISWTGEVCPCYRLLHAGQEVVRGRKKGLKQKSFGNISEKTLEAIWTSPDYMKFRYLVSHNLYPSCTDCDLVNGCDLVMDSDLDCMGNQPACGDCLWARGIIYCP